MTEMSDILDRSKDIGTFIPAEDDDLVICRCEEIKKERSAGQFMTVCGL